MGLDFRFFVETRVLGQWTVPSAFMTYHETGSHPTEFAWISGNSYMTDLFWGDHRLFDMRQELPSDRDSSSFFRWLDLLFKEQPYEWYHSWLPVEELMLDCWDETVLLVEGKFPVRYAHLFEDGQQSFPKASLLQEGVTETEMDQFQPDGISEKPIDQTFGQYRFQQSDLPPEALAKVTWKETIRGFLGEDRANAFLNLRRYGSDPDLRILTLYS